MSHDLVGARHLCVNHREDNLGETGGNRMQKLEGCALSIWTLSCEWWWAAKRFWSGEWHALERRASDKSGGLYNIQGKTKGYGDENSSILNTSTKPFLNLYPPLLLSFPAPHSCVSCTSFIFHLYFILCSQHRPAIQGDIVHQSTIGFALAPGGSALSLMLFKAS